MSANPTKVDKAWFLNRGPRSALPQVTRENLAVTLPCSLFNTWRALVIVMMIEMGTCSLASEHWQRWIVLGIILIFRVGNEPHDSHHSKGLNTRQNVAKNCHRWGWITSKLAIGKLHALDFQMYGASVDIVLVPCADGNRDDMLHKSTASSCGSHLR